MIHARLQNKCSDVRVDTVLRDAARLMSEGEDCFAHNKTPTTRRVSGRLMSAWIDVPTRVDSSPVDDRVVVGVGGSHDAPRHDGGDNHGVFLRAVGLL